jgi:hypothetical protein
MKAVARKSNVNLAWAALKRKLDRKVPGYAV